MSEHKRRRCVSVLLADECVCIGYIVVLYSFTSHIAAVCVADDDIVVVAAASAVANVSVQRK